MPSNHWLPHKRQTSNNTRWAPIEGRPPHNKTCPLSTPHSSHSSHVSQISQRTSDEKSERRGGARPRSQVVPLWHPRPDRVFARAAVLDLPSWAGDPFTNGDDDAPAVNATSEDASLGQLVMGQRGQEAEAQAVASDARVANVDDARPSPRE